MKKIITAIAAVVIGASMTGCASLSSAAAVGLTAMLLTNTFKHKAVEFHETADDYVVVEPPQPDYDHVYAKAMIKLGDDAFSAGYYKQALGHYDEALREWEDYRIYMKIAYCLKKLGNERDFRLVYAKAVSMAPKNAKKTKYTPVVYKYTGVGM